MKTKTAPIICIIIDSFDTAYTTGTLGTATSTVAYGYDSTYWRDQLTSYDGETITYDAVGNPLKWRDGMSFTWKAGRQMNSTKLQNGKTYGYEYNEDGIRYSKWEYGGLNTTYYLDGSTIIAEKNSQNTIIYKHDENGRYVGFNLNGTDYYYAYNAQGDVMGIYSINGAFVARYTYDPWGKVLSVSDANGNAITSSTHVGNINPIRYRGYYYDTETGLYYLNSRYYDPEVGRFVNADGYVQTGTGIMDKNMYAYCNDDPVNMTDSCGYAPYRNEPRFLGPFSVLTPQQQQEHQKIFGAQAKNTEEVFRVDTYIPLIVGDVSIGGKTDINYSSKSNSVITAYSDSGSKKIGISASGKNVSGDWSVSKSGASAKAIFNVSGQNFSIQTTEKLYRMELTVAWSTSISDNMSESNYCTIGINKWVIAAAFVAQPVFAAYAWDTVASAFS